jgi:hypothetical protein
LAPTATQGSANVDRVFVDTVFWLALMNGADQYHRAAVQLRPILLKCREIYTTTAILAEVANSLRSVTHRHLAVKLLEELTKDQAVTVVEMSREVFHAGFEEYKKHSDKAWSLTDSISFVVMRQQSLVNALTADQHFVQAGFSALMRGPQVDSSA